MPLLTDFDAKIFAQAQGLVQDALNAGVWLGCAESCTGGLLGAAITEVAGSSAAFKGSVVSYAIPVKREVLAVPEWIFEDPRLGAVSAECAEHMSQGARRVLAADIAVSVTGIAGPGGAEPGKPVGTVWFGLSTVSNTRSEAQLFSGTRDEVRRQAVLHALGMLRGEFAKG